MLAADRPKFEPANKFEDWFYVLQEKAGQRVDPMAARYLWGRNFGAMEALVKILSR